MADVEWSVFQARDGYWHFFPSDWEGRPEDFAPGHLRVEEAEEALREWRRTIQEEELQREAERESLNRSLSTLVDEDVQFQQDFERGIWGYE